MQYTQAQHEQLIRDLDTKGEHVLAAQHGDWLQACTQFNGTPLEEADLERREAFLVLQAKEYGVYPR